MGLFGDIGKGLFGSGGSFDTKQIDLLTPQQKKIYSDQLARSRNDVNAGSPISGLSPTETMSLEGLQNIAANTRGSIGDGSNPEGKAALDQAAETTRQLQTDGPQNIDKYFQDTIQAPLVKQFTDQILPGIRNSYGNNFYGGERFIKEGRATGDLATTLAQQRTKVGFEEYDKTKDRALSAAQFAPTLDSAFAANPFEKGALATDQLGKILQLSGIGRNVEQQQLDAKNQQKQYLLNLLGIHQFENVVDSRQGTQGLAPGLVNAGASIGAAAIRCDARTKENLLEIGTFHGVKLWFFNYIGDDPANIHVGPMAHEVYEYAPDAVMLVHGYLAIDVNKLELV